MKRLISAILVIIICVLPGCGVLNRGSYHSVTPHKEDSIKTPQQTVTVSSYEQLYDALAALVETGTSKGVFYINGIQNSVHVLMSDAIREVTTYNPIGAYAVDNISFEVGTNAGNMAVAVEIAYTHGRSEILQIRKTDSPSTAYYIVSAALTRCDANLVFIVNHFEDTDFVQMVQDYVDTHPDICMELPQVSVAVYPETGEVRVVDLKFTYQTSRETLRNMQDTVGQFFSSAKLYVNEDSTAWEKYSQLYSFLTERFDYTVETSITPAYSLLRHGVGDSKAFASVYAAMCKQVGLDCVMIVGTREGKPHYWNLLNMDGKYYHLDIINTMGSGDFTPKTEANMQGYVWDYSAYESKSQ